MNIRDERLTVNDPYQLVSFAGVILLIYGIGGVILGFYGSWPWSDILKCVLSAIAGWILVFRSGGVVFDKRSGLAVRWRGFGYPIWKKTYPFDSFSGVAIDREERQSSGESGAKGGLFFVVRVKHRETSIDIAESTKLLEARRMSEDLAKFLNLPIHDGSEGGIIIRPVRSLDLSIREKARRSGRKVAVPLLPDRCRVRWERSGRTITMKVPPPGGLAFYMGIAGLLGGIVFVAAQAEQVTVGALPPIAVQAGFAIAVVGLLCPFRVALHCTSHEHIIVTPEKLEVVLVSRFGRIEKSIPENEIEEFDLAAGRRDVQDDDLPTIMFDSKATIVARSDKTTILMGRGLNDREAEWMHALIMEMLTS